MRGVGFAVEALEIKLKELGARLKLQIEGLRLEDVCAKRPFSGDVAASHRDRHLCHVLKTPNMIKPLRNVIPKKSNELTFIISFP